MTRKNKGVVLDSTPSYGAVVCEDAKVRLKHQNLAQDYQALRKEVDVVRSKLDVGKQRKMVLAAEVRFLRRRYEYLMKMKTVGSSQRENQAQHMKEFGRKEAGQRTLPPIPKAKPKKKQYVGKGVASTGKYGGKEGMHQIPNPNSELNPKVRIHSRNKALIQNASNAAFRNTSLAFNLNQDNNNGSTRKEASLSTRAPIFDLNEISTGEEEDFHCDIEAVDHEEGKTSLMRPPNDEVQNDLMLSVCRNAGEGPSRVGKRKISWQDPVALRV